ncbi:MAG: peptidoglycan DD-metalloendopeptidase family protein [Lachnospiraceae bacterium]|nr:peptidoglycan DD-metalloendopeptidase family protein [Lachnospiraceae bacterium]
MKEDAGAGKKFHTITVTGSDPEEKTLTFQLRNTTIYLIVAGVCVVVGVLLGFIIFETRQVLEISARMTEKQQELSDEYANLAAQYEQLEGQYADEILENEDLTSQVEALTATLQDKLAAEEEASAQAESEALPTGFPVTGSSTPAELPEGESELDEAVYYEGSEGAVVVATGTGTVELIRENAYGYYEVHIDHGNGYVSIYTNMGTPLVREGDAVVRGTPLYLIQEDNTLIKYQITKDNALINVYTIMSVEG